jgi:hypothetical protein
MMASVSDGNRSSKIWKWQMRRCLDEGDCEVCVHKETAERLFDETNSYIDCDECRKASKKKLTCKDCKYYGEVNPEWANTPMADKHGANYSCALYKHNRGKTVCSGGPFLPEEEKKKDKWRHEGEKVYPEMADSSSYSGKTECKAGDLLQYSIKNYVNYNEIFNGPNKVKGQKMRKLAKVVRCGIMLWILYGVGKLVLLVNPLMIKLGRALPGSFIEPYDNNTWYAIAAWLTCIAGVIVFCVGSWLLHKFSGWLFGWLGKK